MSQKYYLEAATHLGKKINTTKSYWNYIVNRKHPEIKNQKHKAIETLTNPDTIKQSQVDEKVFLYYQKITDKYFCIVAKHLDVNGYIVTAYITKKLAKGKIIWQSLKK